MYVCYCLFANLADTEGHTGSIAAEGIDRVHDVNGDRRAEFDPRFVDEVNKLCALPGGVSYPDTSALAVSKRKTQQLLEKQREEHERTVQERVRAELFEFLFDKSVSCTWAESPLKVWAALSTFPACKFQGVARLARKYLMSMVSNAETERLFSTAKFFCRDERGRTSDDNVSMLTMLNAYFKSHAGGTEMWFECNPERNPAHKRRRQ